MKKLILIPVLISFFCIRSFTQIIPFPAFSNARVSNTYEITSDGKPIDNQTIIWRSGVASYARFYVENDAEIVIRCPQSGGKWDISSVKPVDYKSDKNELRIFLKGSNKIMIQTATKEVLYLFAEQYQPNIPVADDKKIFSATEFGINPGGTEILTSKIQKGIDAVAKRGGGTLVFPAGIYITGTLKMKSNVFLYLSAGARIQASINKADYPVDPGKTGKGSEMIYTRLILYDHVSNSGILGLGEIDGGRQAEEIPEAMQGILPNLIRIRNSKNITLEGILLRRAFGWNTHVLYSRDIQIQNMESICNGSDGLDIDNSKQVKINNVLISSHDDSFVLKSTAGRYGLPQNVSHVFMDSTILWTVKSALKFGTETNAKKMENMVFKNVTIAGSRGALVMYLRDGATISNISYKNILVKNSRHSLEWIIKNRNGKGKINHITINNLVSNELNDVIFEGLDNRHRIKNVVLNGFIMGGKPVFDLNAIPGNRNEFVKNITIKN